MIENKKPEIVEENEENPEESARTFVRAGFIIIGSIITLMVLCIIAIVIFENI